MTFLKHAINARGVVHGGAIAGIFDSAVVAVAAYHNPGGPSAFLRSVPFPFERVLLAVRFTCI